MRMLRSVGSVRAATIRVGLLVLLGLLGLGPALPMLHFAVLEHQLCPTHGELMHVHDASVLESAAAPRGARSEVLPSAGEEHVHEHCALSAVSTERPAIVHSDAGRYVLVEHATAPAYDVSEYPHSSVALLAYAPKRAPPV
jgi:hypothetical protein